MVCWIAILAGVVVVVESSVELIAAVWCNRMIVAIGLKSGNEDTE